MPLVTPVQEIDEPISVADAASHLRITDTAHNAEVARLVSVSREYCERQTNRTLRVNVVRQWTLESWPRWDARAGCHLKLPWPPLVNTVLNPITITYLDTNGDEQTVAAADYQVELSTEGFGRLTFLSSFSNPSLADQQSPITVEFTTGYADAEAIPKTAIHAIKTKLTELWGSGTDNELKAAQICTDRLLNTVDATGYA